MGLSPDERARAKKRAERLGSERLALWLEELLVARERMRELPQHARLSLEVALLDLCRPESAVPLAEIASRLEALEARAGQGAIARPVPPAAVAPAAPLRDAQTIWNRFLEELAQNSGTLAETLRTRGRLAELGERRVSARVANLSEDERLLFQNPRNQKACAQILARLLGREVEFVLEGPAAPQRQPKDAFTGRVQELFSGRVEDEG